MRGEGPCILNEREAFSHSPVKIQKLNWRDREREREGQLVTGYRVYSLYATVQCETIFAYRDEA